MKKGQLERKDEETLKAIYKKLTAKGTLKEPLTIGEQVLIYSIAKWIGENVREEYEQRKPF